MTKIEYSINLPDDDLFENELKSRNIFDVWFVSNLQHKRTKWRAVRVRPIDSKKKVIKLIQNVIIGKNVMCNAWDR